MRLMYANLGDTLTCTAIDATSGYPATNVQHQFLSRAWRSSGVSTVEWLMLDAGSGLTCSADTFVIAGHNLTSAATIAVKGNSTNSWAGAPFVATFTFSTEAMLVYTVAQAYRYFRFEFTDAANPDGFVEIGRIGLYVKYQVESAPNGAFTYGIADSTRTSRSITGQKYGDLGIQARTYDLSMGLVSETVRRGLLGVYAVVGQVTPIFLVIDENQTAKIPPLYCTMDQTPKWSVAKGGGWYWNDGGMKFTEAF